MSAAILVINAGSSSLKFALFEDNAALGRLAHGEISGLGGKAHLSARIAGGTATDRALSDVATAIDALANVLEWIDVQFPHTVFSTIGHRVVHGGDRFRRPLVVGDDEALRALDALDPLAPQHQPYNLAALRTLRMRFPRARQVACFDTSFHSDWPDRARRMALPRRFHDDGVRRYGFHGLSYEYLVERMRAVAPEARRVVLAHLGSGASVCAVLDGRSVDASMGFSVLDGLPMGTRCGEIDPGVIFHLHRGYALTFEQIEHLLYYDSGLKGVSGISADMRELLASPAPEAAQAVDLFGYHCQQAIAAMAAALGGIDALVFSGGIGAHAVQIRSRICAGLGFLGVELDETANFSTGERISAAGSTAAVFAIATDEEVVIARHCRASDAAMHGAALTISPEPICDNGVLR